MNHFKNFIFYAFLAFFSLGLAASSYFYHFKLSENQLLIKTLILKAEQIGEVEITSEDDCLDLNLSGFHVRVISFFISCIIFKNLSQNKSIQFFAFDCTRGPPYFA